MLPNRSDLLADFGPLGGASNARILKQEGAINDIPPVLDKSPGQ